MSVVLLRQLWALYIFAMAAKLASYYVKVLGSLGKRLSCVIQICPIL